VVELVVVSRLLSTAEALRPSPAALRGSQCTAVCGRRTTDQKEAVEGPACTGVEHCPSAPSWGGDSLRGLFRPGVAIQPSRPPQPPPRRRTLKLQSSRSPLQLSFYPAPSTHTTPQPVPRVRYRLPPSHVEVSRGKNSGEGASALSAELRWWRLKVDKRSFRGGILTFESHALRPLWSKVVF